MRLPNARRTQDDDVAGPLDEAAAGQLAQLATVERGLEVDIELLEGLVPRETGLAQATLDGPLETPAPLGIQGADQEVLVVQVLGRRLLTDAVELGLQVVELQAIQQHVQFHWPASS